MDLTIPGADYLIGSWLYIFYLGKNVWRDVVASNDRQTAMSLNDIFLTFPQELFLQKIFPKWWKSPPLCYYLHILALDKDGRNWKFLLYGILQLKNSTILADHGALANRSSARSRYVLLKPLTVKRPLLISHPFAED